MLTSPHLLKKHKLFHTRNVDEARVETAKVFCDHRLTPRMRARTFEARHNLVHWRSTSVHYVTYSGDVDVDPGPLDRFFVAMVPLSGVCSVRLGSTNFTTQRGAATIAGPAEPLTMRWSADCAKLILKYQMSPLTHQLETMLHEQVDEPLRFEPYADLSNGLAAQWWSHQWDVALRLDADDALLGHPQMSAALDQSQMTALLLTHHHNYSSCLNAERAPAPARRDIRAVIDCVESDPGRPVTVGDLAAVAGTSVRSLQAGFERHLGISPMTYVKQVRLRRAYEALRASDPTERGVVTKVARSYGFSHLSRFAADFRQQFGKTPKEVVQGGVEKRARTIPA